MSGSHALTTPTMVFIVARTMARSSASSVQISLAQLERGVRRKPKGKDHKVPDKFLTALNMDLRHDDAGQAYMLAS